MKKCTYKFVNDPNHTNSYSY
jgi:hypothetical protein